MRFNDQKISGLIRFILFTILLFATGEITASAKIRIQPYLQAVTKNSVYVMALSDTKEEVIVKYGKSQEYGETAKTSSIEKAIGKSRYIHRVELTGLEPNTVYHYSVSQGADTWKDESFRSAAAPGTSFKFAIFGDCRSQIDTHAKVITELKKKEPYFSLYTGDLCNDSKYDTWIREFFIPEELDAIKDIPFFNAIGNHEGWAQNTKAFLQAPESPSGEQYYYSFEYGDMFVLVISTEHDVSPGSPQYEYAKKALKETKRKWKVALWHKPAYCAGGHGDDTDMIKFTRDIIDQNGVDFVFSGHSHFYQHNFVNGVRHLTIGGGGAPLYTPAKGPFTEKSAQKHNFAIADVTFESFKVTVYDSDGNKIDIIEIIK